MLLAEFLLVGTSTEIIRSQKVRIRFVFSFIHWVKINSVLFSHYSDNPFEFGISFSSYALNRNTSSMFDILKEVFTSKIDDIEQLQSIIFMVSCVILYCNYYKCSDFLFNHQQTTSRFEEKLTDSGHQYAMSYSARNLSKQHQLLEQLNGVSYLKYLRSITTPEHLTDILNNLRVLFLSLFFYYIIY